MRGAYDIVLINGKEVAIVEVKYKVYLDDIDKLDKKLKSFPLLFTDYKDYKIRGAVASLSMSKNAEEKILQKGYFALKQQGNHVEISVPQ